MSRAAIPIATGIGLLGIGCIFAWIWPDGVGRNAALGPWVLGVSFLMWGVGQLVDVVERAARKILERE